jgi:hypothetical protein
VQEKYLADAFEEREIVHPNLEGMDEYGLAIEERYV